MRFEEPFWDEENERHIAKHNVTEEEVEDVVRDPASRVFKIAKKLDYRRYIVQGITWPGRYLFVVLDYLGRGIYRPVTARDMDDDEKSSFKSK